VEANIKKYDAFDNVIRNDYCISLHY